LEGDHCNARTVAAEILNAHGDQTAGIRLDRIEDRVRAIREVSLDSLIDAGMEGFFQGDMARVEKALQRLAGEPHGELLQANIARNNDDYEKASVHLDRAVEMDEDMISARLTRATNYLHFQQYDFAHADLMFALSRIDPERPRRVEWAFRVLAKLFAFERNSNRAFSDLLALEDRWSETCQYQLLRGTVFSETGNRPFARSALIKALKLNPQNGQAAKLLEGISKADT
jgi:tetratricopeptide (TPR) repeat protein